MRLPLLLVSALVRCANGLEARWTPAADGGPARFSKRYRDAAGIDDSKWTGDGEGSASWMPQVLPDTVQGWVVAALAAACIYALYLQQQPRPNYARDTGGARWPGNAASRSAGEASEAAREAFLRKYDKAS